MATLDLSSRGLDSQSLPQALSSTNIDMQEVEIVNLGSNSLKPEDLNLLFSKHLSMKKIEELYISNNKLGDEGCRILSKYLSQASKLKRLELGFNNISHKGCETLCSVLSFNFAPKLTSLSFRYNSIGLGGAVHIAKMIQKRKKDLPFKSLDLTGNFLGDDGCITICEALVSSTFSLERLTLWGNAITDVSCTSLCQLLRNSVDLKYLELSSNSLSQSSLEQFYDIASKENNNILDIGIAGNRFKDRFIATKFEKLFLPRKKMNDLLKEGEYGQKKQQQSQQQPQQQPQQSQQQPQQQSQQEKGKQKEQLEYSNLISNSLTNSNEEVNKLTLELEPTDVNVSCYSMMNSVKNIDTDFQDMNALEAAKREFEKMKAEHVMWINRKESLLLESKLKIDTRVRQEVNNAIQVLQSKGVINPKFKINVVVKGNV